MRFVKPASAIAFFSLSLAIAACSSAKNDPAPVTPAPDTGTPPEEDSGPVEDTAPPPWATYPEGPYGLDKGKIFPPLETEGYKGGEGGTWGALKMIDYYDPDGTRGVYAILVVVSAEWCGPCREEAKTLPSFYTNLYKPRGAQFLSLMIENADATHSPATQATVDRWNKAFHPNFDIGLDSDKAALPPSWAIPRNYIINPRDMRIYRVNVGTNPDATSVPGLSVLLSANGAPPAPPVDSGTDTGSGGDTGSSSDGSAD